MSSGLPSVCTRRNATVTNWLPVAAILARMTSPELYLPVPTNSREVSSTPAITRGFVFMKN
jgi:uncharacterized protein YbjT (DUF2867 family)